MLDYLKIKVLKIHHIPSGRIKAFVDVVVNESLLIKGLRIVSSNKGGVFVTMPQELGKNKRWYDRIKCLNPELRKHMHSLVLEAYECSQKYAF